MLSGVSLAAFSTTGASPPGMQPALRVPVAPPTGIVPALSPPTQAGMGAAGTPSGPVPSQTLPRGSLLNLSV